MTPKANGSEVAPVRRGKRLDDSTGLTDGQSPDAVTATRLGLRFPPALKYDDWQRAGRHITRIINSSAWFLGDWVDYGESQYANRYREAIEAAHLDYQTVRNYAWVARRFELSRRREGLSFQHHAEVAALLPAEQDAWLDRAEQNGWSRNQLRQQLRAHRRGDGADHERTVIPRILVTTESVQRWQAAAEQVDSAFENWVVASLNVAASQVLGEGEQSALGPV